MAVCAKLFFFDYLVGHVGLMIYDTKYPDLHGFYISSNCTGELKNALTQKDNFFDPRSDIYAHLQDTPIDYNRHFLADIQKYGTPDVMEVQLCQKDNLTMFDVYQALKKNVDYITGPYSLTSHNCANIVVAVLKYLGYYDDKKDENELCLRPKVVYDEMAALPGSVCTPAIKAAFQMISDSAKKLASIAEDLRKRHYDTAGNTASTLAAEIASALNKFEETQQKMTPAERFAEWQKIQGDIINKVDAADGDLAKHRGCKKILGNIVLFVLLVGVFWALTCAVRQKFFFSNTKTSALTHNIARIAALALNKSPENVPQAANDAKSVSPVECKV